MINKPVNYSQNNFFNLVLFVFSGASLWNKFKDSPEKWNLNFINKKYSFQKEKKLWLVKKNKEPLTVAIKWLLPATALFTMSTFGNKFCWKQKLIHIRGWAFQSNVEVANAKLSRNFWIGACNEWQKIAWKVQSKNNCKGNNWCVKTSCGVVLLWTESVL